MNHDNHQAYFKFIQQMAKRRKVRVYLVGGFLRDSLLGRPSCDLDFAVSDRALSFAKSFAKQIKGAFILLDEERGCGRVAKKVRGKVMTFDFSDFRSDSLKKDLQSRDFTINALALDVERCQEGSFEERIQDPLNGRRDLAARCIRMASARAFQDDPLRILRAFSLRAVLGFRIDPQTKKQIKKELSLIRTVSAERIRDEFFKILESDRAGVVLGEMDRIGLLELVIPQIRVMFDVKQGTYHHLDVWPHSLETVRQCEQLIRTYQSHSDVGPYLTAIVAGNRSRKALLKLACLLHDVGKPASLTRQGERICFHGHEHIGKSITAHVARLLKLSTRERHLLCDMVEMHLRPGYLSNFKRPSSKAVFRYFRDARDEAVSIALLTIADQRSTRGPLTTPEDIAHLEEVCGNLIERYFEMQRQEPFVPLVNGDDLIQILKLKPSPLFSKILKGLEEGQVTGKIQHKEQALDMARALAQRYQQ